MPVMPIRSGADNLEKRSVALPPDLWAAADKIAAINTEKPSEVYRRIFVGGVSAEHDRLAIDLSYENKQLVNQRLRAKRDGAVEALQILSGIAPPSELAAAIKAITVWLSE